ncbi:NADH dehydrogenase [ubiquinone] 1 alpha subcomplex assembly factor 5 [Orchesella cincta]|uniref:NADH dehydrogenase [ubiquinone] 1 alpha subcomplex assembly factor 5 n=1 Tax=Orchesella cincta TaxID=48709 RepID=A0A1D2N3S7_ORCCI|nr:NADH dehydrogenase [ubiquinone] 1 alpha subcomplex assembly factor 5 [Orchesella cincta]
MEMPMMLQFGLSSRFVRNLTSKLVQTQRGSCALGNYRQLSTDKKPAPAKPNYLNVFDRQTKLLQRKRAAELVKVKDGKDSGMYDYIKDEVGFILADRIIDIKRDINRVLDLGCGRGHILKHLNNEMVGSIVATDICQEWLDQIDAPEDVTCEKLLMDEEILCFNQTHSTCLHWVNNLPKAFSNIYRCLKPDGVFLGAMFGCNTLFELRCSLQLAELEREGGMGSHISPFAEIQDVGGLLSINGFTMLTIDTQEIKVGFPSVFELMEDLKGMAENNASWRRKVRISRDTLFSAAAIYKGLRLNYRTLLLSLFNFLTTLYVILSDKPVSCIQVFLSLEMYGNEDGTIPATFQIIYMIAWKPDPSQPRPLAQQKPDVSLKDLDRLR